MSQTVPDMPEILKNGKTEIVFSRKMYSNNLFHLQLTTLQQCPHQNLIIGLLKLELLQN